MMGRSITDDESSSSLDGFEIPDLSIAGEGTDEVENQFRTLSLGTGPRQQQPSDSSSDLAIISARQPQLAVSISLPASPSSLHSQIGPAAPQSRGRTLRNRRLLRNSQYLLVPAASRVREIVRRPRCGLHLVRSLRNDKHVALPEPRSDPAKPPRQPGRVDRLFTPKDGDLLLHHDKKVGKRVLEFFDAEQPPPRPFEEGDYLLRFKVENYSFMHQSFVTARGYLYHHGSWVYLGQDSDHMELV